MNEHFGWQLLFCWNCFLAIFMVCSPFYYFAASLGACRRLNLVKNGRPRPKEDLAEPISAAVPGECSKRPSVSIITPVKALTNKTADIMDNFRSQIVHAYNGRTENIYVFEDDQDPGVEMVKKLQQQYQGHHDIHIVYAGLAKTCSQKIHNLLAGVDAAHPESEYIYFLDISTRCVNSTMSVLVDHVRASKGKCLVASGYPLDVAPPGSGAFAWTLIQVRYAILAFVAMQIDASYAWGGAMMIRKDRFDKEKDPLKIRQTWTDGSVQDDMVLNSIAMENGLIASSVPQALFFNELRQGISYATSFDFIQRQVFVAACYHSLMTRIRHIGMLASFVIPATCVASSHLVALFVLMIHFGIVECEYLELYPFARTMAIAILLAPLVIAAAQVLFIRTLGKIYNIVAAGDPAAPVFPLRTLNYFTTAYYFYLTMWINAWIAIYSSYSSLLLGSIDWAGIRYTVKDGKVCRVTHIDAGKKK